MPRRFFRRVSTDYLRNERPWFLRPFRALLDHPTFFSVTRRSVAGAFWVGIFIALLPIPGQTILALMIALVLRVNLPIAGIATWVTNPLTIVPIFYSEYRLGTFILDVPESDFNIDLSWNWIAGGLLEIWKPLMLGSFITATVVASATYITLSQVWRWTIAIRYKRRRFLEKRFARRRSK